MRPTDRAPGLQQIGHAHHDTVRLCRKIREAIDENVASSRIQRYCRHFLRKQLEPRFHFEEEVVFPVLGRDHPAVRKALAEHRRLRRLINGNMDPMVAVSLLEEELEAHVRFEERRLFNDILKKATPQQLARMRDASLALPAPSPIDRPLGSR